MIRQDRRIGNLLFITPLLRELKKEFPDCELDLLTAGDFSDIFDDNPSIDRLIEYHHKEQIYKPWKLPALLMALRRRRYDMVIDTKDVLSFNNAMLAALCGGNSVVGYNYRGSEYIHDLRIAIPPAESYEPRRHLKLLEAVVGKGISDDKMEFFLSDEETASAQAYLGENGLEPGQFIAIHCGGRGRKAYGVGRFFNIARRLYENESLPSLIIYGPDEKSEIAKLKPSEGIVMAGPENVRQMAGLIERSRLFLSGDTGALHVAVALGKPTVSIFIGSYWARYAPKGDKHKVYYKLDSPPPEEVVIGMIMEDIQNESV